LILCFDLSGVVTGRFLGRLRDRYQPQRVMDFDNLARTALIAAIPTLYAWDRFWYEARYSSHLFNRGNIGDEQD
jgi:hypothetical protein